MSQKHRVGIVFGCFIPLHKGHVAMIRRAREENDQVIIGVTGHDMDRGRDFVPFLRRVRLMRSIYGNFPDVLISEVDDRAVGLTGTFSEEAWRTWCDELFRQARLSPTHPERECTWYTSDADYAAKIGKIYPSHKFVQLDRDVVPVSGTSIRADVAAHRDDIHPVFLRYLDDHPIP